MCSIYSFRVRSFSPCSSPHPLSGVEREQTNASILRRDLLTTSGTYADACAQLVHVASAFDQLLALVERIFHLSLRTTPLQQRRVLVVA